ncbi:MAG: hypothetical protein P8P30_09310 [Rickettsiales bacterium]|nr:hypothetical protein [Rickettsiales bacterium]
MRRHTKESFTLLASWLILFQLFAPLAYAGQELTLICGEQGVQEVSFDADGNPVELPSLNKHCELCVLSFAVLADELSLSQTHAAIYTSAPLEQRFLLSPNPKGFTSRAPPTLS